MKLTLLEKKQETPTVTSFIFAPAEPLSWTAGQFLHYVLHHEPTDDRGSDRWFTNSAAPFENHVQITTRITKDTGSTFKKKLLEREIGKSIEISDVDGDFVIADLTKEYVFIAGGIGITPFRSILAQLNHEGKQIHATLLYANKSRDDVVFQKELDSYAQKNPEFRIAYVFSPEHIDEVKIQAVVPDFAQKEVFVSGPEPMVESLGEMLKKMGLPEEKLHQDFFPGYKAE